MLSLTGSVLYYQRLVYIGGAPCASELIYLNSSDHLILRHILGVMANATVVDTFAHRLSGSPDDRCRAGPDLP